LKLGKTSWLVLSLGIFIIVFSSLGLARFQQVGDKTQIQDELIIAGNRLNNLQLKELYSQQEEMEEQVKQGEAQAEMAKAILRHPIVSIEVTDVIFQIAAANNVEIASIGSSDIDKGTLEDITCDRIRLNISVNGEVEDIIDFVTSLNEDYATGLADSAVIKVTGTLESLGEAGGAPTGNVTAEADGQSLGNVNLTIYSYQGG